MRLFFLGLLIVCATLQAQQKEAFNFNRKYHPDSLIRGTHSVMTELSRKHPDFNRYTTKERFDFLIDSTIQTITDSLTTIEFYRKVKPLFAHIGCLKYWSGTIPDYLVIPTLNDWVEEKDVEKQFVMGLMKTME